MNKTHYTTLTHEERDEIYQNAYGAWLNAIGLAGRAKRAGNTKREREQLKIAAKHEATMDAHKPLSS